MGACSDCDCGVFVAHAFKKGQCRECFHPEDKHTGSGDSGGDSSQPDVSSLSVKEETLPEPTAPAQPTTPTPQTSAPAPTATSNNGEQDGSEDKTQDATTTTTTTTTATTTTTTTMVSTEPPKCDKCTEAITGNFVSAMSRNFHTACFVCAGDCGTSLDGIPYVPVDGTPYCPECYKTKGIQGNSEGTQVCAKCQEPLTGQYVTVEGTQYHSQCFTCSSEGCDAKATFLSDDMPVCADHVKQDPQQGKPCEGCGEAIDGEAVLALDKYFHPPCFKCTLCGQAIAQSQFVVVDDEIKHQKCPE